MRHQDRMWREPPGTLGVEPGEVHVWRVGLDIPEQGVQACYQVLSEDERQRAERYCFDRDRQRFVACRGALRMILGRYMGVDPAWLRFVYGPQGKPSLDPQRSTHGMDAGTLRYNVAYARELGLIAVACRRKVGVDIEYQWPELATLDVARRFFSAAEIEEFSALPEAERVEAFFNGWTRKEAYLKALGEGPSYPLRAITVSLTPGQPARLLAASGEFKPGGPWTLLSLDATDNRATGRYAAALAVEGRSWRLRCWQFSGWQSTRSVDEVADALGVY
ncbi:MAG: 4'-phosphopantetheinyl transferase family protein [Anaerolineae bacterium]